MKSLYSFFKYKNYVFIIVFLIVLLFFGRMLLFRYEDREFLKNNCISLGKYQMIYDDRYDINFYPKLTVIYENKKLPVKKVLNISTISAPETYWEVNELIATEVKPNEKIFLNFNKIPDEKVLTIGDFNKTLSKKYAILSDYIITPKEAGTYLIQIDTTWKKDISKVHTIYYVFYLKVKK